MSSSPEKETQPFILSQLEEALEERQNNDRRQKDHPIDPQVEDRRKGNRRDK